MSIIPGHTHTHFTPSGTSLCCIEGLERSPLHAYDARARAHVQAHVHTHAHLHTHGHVHTHAPHAIYLATQAKHCYSAPASAIYLSVSNMTRMAWARSGQSTISKWSRGCTHTM